MSHLFVEMYNYTEAWRRENPRARRDYIARVLAIIAQLPERGIEVVGFAFNEPETDNRAPYDFFCVYRVTDQATQRVFEKAISEAGWYEFFDQVNLSGAAQSPDAVLSANAEPDVTTR